MVGSVAARVCDATIVSVGRKVYEDRDGEEREGRRLGTPRAVEGL